MPIYEFKCKRCGDIFEYLCFSVSGEDRGTCPSCGASESEKVLSTFSSIISGSGRSTEASCNPSSCASDGGFS
jgi:putative FmdB family regulatory protein